MQVRRIVPLAALAVAAAGAYLPASATTPKFAGSYKVSLQPDPTPNATSAAGMPVCAGVNPGAVDHHALTVPAGGKFKVILDSPDPTGRGLTDWDMTVTDPAGKELGSSHGGTSHEEVSLALKGKTPMTITVCNLVGAPDGTITYTLK